MFSFLRNPEIAETYLLSLHDALPICCPAVVSLKVRIEPTRTYESFDRAGLLRQSRGLATDAPPRLRGKGRGRSKCRGSMEEHTDELQYLEPLVGLLELEC